MRRRDFYQRAKDIKSDGAEIIDEAEKFLADLSTMSSELGLKIK